MSSNELQRYKGGIQSNLPTIAASVDNPNFTSPVWSSRAWFSWYYLICSCALIGPIYTDKGMEWLPSDFWESCVLVCTSWMLLDRMCYICVLQGSELFPILEVLWFLCLYICLLTTQLPVPVEAKGGWRIAWNWGYSLSWVSMCVLRFQPQSLSRGASTLSHWAVSQDAEFLELLHEM